jgi:transcriptional regulator with XRE-family HTH domain
MANLQLIKDIAEAKKIPLSVIALELGITPQALSKLIRNNSTKIETLERIATILKVPVTTFFHNETNSNIVSQSTIGDNSPNIAINHNALLEERIKSLEALLSEKERLIKVYEKIQNKQ